MTVLNANMESTKKTLSLESWGAERCSTVPCGLYHSLTWLPGRQTARDPAAGQCCPSGGLLLLSLRTLISISVALPTILPAYTKLNKSCKLSEKRVLLWTNEATTALWDCSECTDWHMLRDTATQQNHADDVYTSAVTSYISKCFDDVVVTQRRKESYM